MVESLLKPTQELIVVKYFISRFKNDPDKQKQQSTYLDALESVDVQIFYGNLAFNLVECLDCGYSWTIAKEKMTDVNIATSMIVDAFRDEYDMAMLISGDSDLIPPIRAIHQLFKNKRVFIAFPPSRHNSSMARVAKGSEIIGRKRLADAQFPDEVTSKTGYILKVPHRWKH
jgi:uncharacterized LabA/DUF88 family protein